MKELIAVNNIEINGATIPAVSARELYLGLGLAPQHWSTWAKSNIEGNEFFSQSIDFVQLPTMGSTPNPPNEYAITIEFAKHLAMMAKTEKAHDYRNYFIALERKPMSAMEMVITSAQAIMRLEQEQASQARRIEAIEAKQSAITEGFSYFTILAFATLNHINIDLTTAQKLGRAAAQRSRDLDVPIDSVRDPRFGSVYAYKEDILKMVFAEALAE